MVRALVLAVAALAVALLPAPRAVRAVFAGLLLIGAVLVGIVVEQQKRDREAEAVAEQAREALLWENPPLGAFRITGWTTSAPLRYGDRWVVDATFTVVPATGDPFTGLEIAVVAHDCRDPSAPAATCPVLGRATARRSFADLGRSADRSIRLRFEFPDAPFPGGHLRLEPSIEGVRR